MSVVRGIFHSGDLPVSRLEAFSDGVIAIIITILVLEIKVPELHQGFSDSILLEALFHILPKILSYVVSFIVVAVWWVAHHQLLHIVRSANRGVLWLNSLFLMFLAFIPFPTALIGEYPESKVSAIIYGMTAALTGLAFFSMRWYITAHAQLTKHEISAQVLKASLRRGLLSPVLYIIASSLAFVSPFLALALFGLIPIYYIMPGLLERSSSSEKS